MVHPKPTVDEAIAFICETIKRPHLLPNRQPYGYTVYLPEVAYAWVIHNHGDPRNHYATDEAGEPLIEAAIELCQQGVLRPGVAGLGGQGTAKGLGFSLTAFGRRWLENGEDVPRSASAMAQVFHTLAGRFGRAFDIRAQEAVACIHAGVPLAACAMAGAAAEAILLELASAKRGSREGVLDDYRKASGRKTVTDYLLGKASKVVRQNIEPGLELLNYWRDEAAHGDVTQVAAPMAAAAIDRLYRLATYAADNWVTLTDKPE